MLFAVKANCSTLTRTSPAVVEQRDALVFVRLMSARSTRKSVVCTRMARVHRPDQAGLVSDRSAIMDGQESGHLSFSSGSTRGSSRASIIRLASVTISSERLFSRLEGLSGNARVEPGDNRAPIRCSDNAATSPGRGAAIGRSGDSRARRRHHCPIQDGPKVANY